MKRVVALAVVLTVVAVGALAAVQLPKAGASWGRSHALPAHGPADVIVQGANAEVAAAAVADVGGNVTASLPIVDGVSATVPASHLQQLERTPGILSVTPNDPITFFEETTTTPPAPTSVFLDELNVRNLPRSVDGANATVALIDTGVAAVPDLAGRVVPVPDPQPATPPNPGDPLPFVPCADFSGDTPIGTPPSCGDGFGHGTFMAGLVAGDGTASQGRYPGVAPKARIADIKIAGANGASDVSKVLAALQYVVSFKDAVQPPIRVVNLSLGTTSRKDYRHDPLNFAVQRAWSAGLVVVVAAGNDGPGPGTISKPADDPLVLTVGAVDDVQTATLEDDLLPNFSGRGPARFEDYSDPSGTATNPDGSPLEVAKPDVVAPGAHLVSLRPVDAAGNPTPTGIPAPAPGSWSLPHYRQGSGTSLATATVSGVAALYADAVARSGRAWTNRDPQRFKAAVMHTARGVASTNRSAIGSGLVNAPGTISRALANDVAAPTVTAQGDGSLHASRGLATETVRPCSNEERIARGRPVGVCEIVITGERTAQDKLWDPENFRGPWTPATWYQSNWYGASWYLTRWTGSWQGTNWSGSSWYDRLVGGSFGTTTTGSQWYGAWK